MLLRHTTPEIKPRAALTVNPIKTCQPIGAMYAALGVHACLPHSHGSHGCCAYHRSMLSRHYKEPVLAATSSFTEASSVFGGHTNLLQAIENIFAIYDPEIIAIHTTCLSETIGDNLQGIIAKAAQDGKIPTGKVVIHCNTPSYVGSHVTGFSNMVTGFVKHLSECKRPTSSRAQARQRINIIPGWVEPSDMREIKRLAAVMGLDTIVFPDTSDTLDCPLTGKYEMYPRGGVTVQKLRDTGSSKATIALGSTTSSAAAGELEKKCGVPKEILDLPIGLTATDRFIDALRRLGEVRVPRSVEDERGRLVDLICDSNQYTYGRRVALWGDPDQLVALCEFLLDLDMRPVYVVTGTPMKHFGDRMAKVLGDRVPEAKIAFGHAADMYLLHQWIKNERVDLLIGNTYGKYIARDEDIPLIRHGFPILDRQGHQHFPTVGYLGALRLLDKILDTIQSRQDRDSPEERFELTL